MTKDEALHAWFNKAVHKVRPNGRQIRGHRGNRPVYAARADKGDLCGST